MSKGLSWQQRDLLRTLIQRENEQSADQHNVGDPIAWRELDYEAAGHHHEDSFYNPSVKWNIEQSTRRALRSLEKRGLVELGRWVFELYPEPHDPLWGTRYFWNYVDSDDHVPGESRIMTGVKSTALGREFAARAGLI